MKEKYILAQTDGLAAYKTGCGGWLEMVSSGVPSSILEPSERKEKTEGKYCGRRQGRVQRHPCLLWQSVKGG